MKLLLSDAAREDLAEIYQFSREGWGVARARDYMADLRSTLRRLAEGQSSGIRAEDVSPGLRRQLAGAHVIWFRVEPGILRVIRVLHQSRDAGRWMG